jgi:hypothetical protein
MHIARVMARSDQATADQLLDQGIPLAETIEGDTIDSRVYLCILSYRALSSSHKPTIGRCICKLSSRSNGGSQSEIGPKGSPFLYPPACRRSPGQRHYCEAGYLELEREGVIVMQQGKGSHVASTPRPRHTATGAGVGAAPGTGNPTGGSARHQA